MERISRIRLTGQSQDQMPVQENGIEMGPTVTHKSPDLVPSLRDTSEPLLMVCFKKMVSGCGSRT
jgi:hypothetical protein